MSLSKLRRPDPRYSADYVRTLTSSEQASWAWKVGGENLLFLEKDWLFWARDSQLPPEQWGRDGCYMWNIRAGRGYGKTRTGAETFIYAIKECGYQHPNLAGATSEDVRDLMIEGESGILACAREDFYPEFVPTLKKLIWPNGVVTHIYYGTEPDKARGPQSDFLWCDELAKWQYPEETLDNLLMGLRLGNDPRCLLTSTPRPTKFLMELEKRKDPLGRPSCVVTRGNTTDNRDNLSTIFLSTIISKYEGTRLGRQELEGEFLDDNPDALWKRKSIEDNRVTKTPELAQIMVGVDPAAKSEKTSDDTGIIVAGKGYDGHGYVLEDCTLHGTPKEWATAVITAFNKYKANWVIGETNQGGEMIEYTIQSIEKDTPIPFKAVHATRGKEIRAEPISALYEQNRVHHCGTFRELEDEMVEWIPNSGMKSPNRVDALTWCLTALNLPTGNAKIPPGFASGFSFNDVRTIEDFRGL
jgi:phage terminase large subunit-like protein